MIDLNVIRVLLCVLLKGSILIHCSAQGTVADYKRARDYKSTYNDKLYNVPLSDGWSTDGNEYWYEKQTVNGRNFVSVNVLQGIKKELFSLSDILTALERKLVKSIDQTALDRDKFILSDGIFEFEYQDYLWSWSIAEKKLTQKGTVENRDKSYYWGHIADESEGEGILSPDGRRKAFIRDNNIFVSTADDSLTARQLTFDGVKGDFYSAQIHWSPDNQKIATSKVRTATVRQLTLIESSPVDQLQPKLHTRDYPKPGDTLSQYFPVIYNLEKDTLYRSNEQLIENQFSISRIDWRKDSQSITFEYNKRGHQKYVVYELLAGNGSMRPIIEETSDTFIDYSGKRFRSDVNQNQIIWASERDGWNHLYLYDFQKGTVINQITSGQWVVRKVVLVDTANHEIIFEASGMVSGQDPYLVQLYSIDFDGGNLRALTQEDGNHSVLFNDAFTYFVDRYSRVDTAPVTLLRDRKGKKIMELERADVTELGKRGWRAPEVFTAKGRDQQTDIWGIIIRPTDFDSTKVYPIIEYIYAGPHSSFVPKSFTVNPSGMQELAELGFIVVQIDGMGTSNRSKAFQNVSWKNLKDAGFEDRILWIKDAAKKYSYMDTTRVGIYGTSAGGQSSTAALLFHPEFYKVGVSSCGCHDNRMDKIWWNEQWMGWPVGPQYAECSNVENASKLQGNLMLIVGELDDNVDPSSTFQLSNALIKANKEHELILVPGMGHSSGGIYGERKRRDYFVRHLLQVQPPSWDDY